MSNEPIKTHDEESFRMGAKEMFDALQMRVANNWHPAAAVECKRQNDWAKAWAEDALEEVDPEDLTVWKNLTTMHEEGYTAGVRDTERKIKKEQDQSVPLLKWTDPSPPNDKCPYDHVIAETPFGRFLITWKSWKKFQRPSIDETPWGDWYKECFDLDSAKAECQRAYDERLCSALAGGTSTATEKTE